MRETHELATTSLRCPSCERPFFFAQSPGAVWRTECPSETCGEVLVVSREFGFRLRVDPAEAYLRHRFREAAAKAERVFTRGPSLAIFLVVALLCIGGLWLIGASPVVEGAFAVVSVVCALLVVGVVALGVSRHFDARRAEDAELRSVARTLGRSPFVATRAAPGWTHARD